MCHPKIRIKLDRAAGAAAAQQFASSIVSTPAALSSLIKTFEEAGADELVLWPYLPKLDQIKRLADLISV